MLLVLLIISFYDICRHRIPNISLLFLIFAQFLFSSLYFNRSLIVSMLIFSIVSRTLCNLGGGDIKLISVLAIFCIPQSAISQLFMGIGVCTVVMMCIYALRFRNLQVAIPLAPAISGGYLSTIFL
ncbi:MAG: prepilin peptidase [Candidatus Planktophila sp.]